MPTTHSVQNQSVNLSKHEVTVGEDDGEANAPVPTANYPHPTSSPEFTRLLVQCFVDARNAAIDEQQADKASGA